MAISQPGYPITTASLVSYLGAYADGLTAATGLVDRKPGTAADAFGVQFQFVTEKDGVDTNDGLSWGSAKKEIQAAIAATPNGGVIYVAPGSYRPLTTLTLNGHIVIGMGPYGGTAVNKTVTILHNFNGDLIKFQGGGELAGVFLAQMGNFTGAAISATSTTASRTGSIYVSDVRISSGDGVNGFQRVIDLDGSADSTAGGPGLRSTFFNNVECFGCKTTGETIRLNRVLHSYWTNVNIIQAPENTVTQGLKILHAESDDILMSNLYVLGNVSSQGAGTDGIVINGSVTGTVTCETGSNFNIFTGKLGGAWTNLGGAGNEGPRGTIKGARVTKSAAQSLTSATLTAIAWGAEDFDTDAQHDTVTNNTRLTCQVAGKYRIYGTLVFGASATGERSIVFKVNNATYVGGHQGAPNPTAGVSSAVSASTTATLAVGDFVECLGQQTSGGALNVDIASASIGIPSHFGFERIP